MGDTSVRRDPFVFILEKGTERVLGGHRGSVGLQRLMGSYYMFREIVDWGWMENIGEGGVGWSLKR